MKHEQWGEIPDIITGEYQNFPGRYDNKKVISKDDVLNLIIDLETSMTFTDFLYKIGYTDTERSAKRAVNEAENKVRKFSGISDYYGHGSLERDM